MAISVVSGQLLFIDDNTGSPIRTIWNEVSGNQTGALIGASSYLLFGTTASGAVQQAANPSFSRVTIPELLRRLLLSSDLTPDRIDQAVGYR